MSEPWGMISTTELAGILDRPNLRLFDCTTYLEPAARGQQRALYRRARQPQTFAAGHIPGADFLDLQGEFSKQGIELRFMMPDVAQLEAAFGRHSIGPDSRVMLYSHRHPDVGDAVLVDAGDRSAATGMPPCSMAASTNGRPRSGRSRPDPRRDIRRRPSRLSRKPGFFVGKDEVLAAVRDHSAVVVNALGPQFHKGLEPSRYGRPGGIPGSLQRSAATLLDPSTPASSCCSRTPRPNSRPRA